MFKAYYLLKEFAYSVSFSDIELALLMPLTSSDTCKLFSLERFILIVPTLLFSVFTIERIAFVTPADDCVLLRKFDFNIVFPIILFVSSRIGSRSSISDFFIVIAFLCQCV